jgi:hypothetical protein
VILFPRIWKETTSSKLKAVLEILCYRVMITAELGHVEEVIIEGIFLCEVRTVAYLT